MNRSGQAIAEYVMLLAIVVLIYSALLKSLGGSGSFQALRKPFVEQLKYTYRYGHPDARGQEDGGPRLIPQYSDLGGGTENFRIFINPSKQ
ncbi:MAG: hypothetical protein KGP28_12000 [Bdellovibrionales bacterium]|nr:hypothetical protein [Bdellovibrionales bacterium]